MNKRQKEVKPVKWDRRTRKPSNVGIDCFVGKAWELRLAAIIGKRLGGLELRRFM